MTELKISPKPGSAVAVVDLVCMARLSASKSEARRAIEGGGVMIDDKVVLDWKTSVNPVDGMTIRVGKTGIATVKIA